MSLYISQWFELINTPNGGEEDITMDEWKGEWVEEVQKKWAEEKRRL